MKKRTAWILVAAVASVAVGAAAMGAVALLFRGDGVGLGLVKAKLLSLRLEGELPEHSASDLGSLFEQRKASLRTVVESLEQAAHDPDISGAIVRVVIETHGLSIASTWQDMNLAAYCQVILAYD